MSYKKEIFDVIVVGGGHAGCEAALAAARMGAKTALITMNISTVAQMSCNPAIGGLAKGHLVRELDALGGEMAKVTDAEGIQFRMLNTSKGPAVWSLRAQADRQAYTAHMRRVLEHQDNLELKQTEVTEILVEMRRCVGVKTVIGTEISARAVILTNGTFLNGLIHIGLFSYSAGRAGEFAATGLTENLMGLGFTAGRLKTGTPPRIDGRSIDFASMTIQHGDENPVPFSFHTKELAVEQMPCYLTSTNSRTHEIIKSGLDRSPIFTGKIVGIGPRYCPSIETKLVQFSDKISHQLYLEPEGRNTTEYYLNGFATSIPEDIQVDAVHSIPGLERAKITRLGYAIEYDFFPSNQLFATLETKLIENLYFAGQINGTSGYEEAAVQGFMAAVNAVQKLNSQAPVVLSRSQAYIGVLIDDLITREVTEPYRMFTSLAEYRLMLRQDNADLRLGEIGYRLGLNRADFFSRIQIKKELIEKLIREMRATRVAPVDVNSILLSKQTAQISEKESIAQLIKRPEIKIKDLLKFIHFVSSEIDVNGKLMQEVLDQVEIEIKYEGYLSRQNEQVSRYEKMENQLIPGSFDYEGIGALSREAREKLIKIKPRSVGQASRIAGVSPSDVAVLLIHLKK
ncbi:MAG: tRNA uridine-5-carboxymethylaminomethyl(34) synthesis enzyme MnmG [Candidatus Zhuqueibacterota bacterium]